MSSGVAEFLSTREPVTHDLTGFAAQLKLSIHPANNRKIRISGIPDLEAPIVYGDFLLVKAGPYVYRYRVRAYNGHVATAIHDPAEEPAK